MTTLAAYLNPNDAPTFQALLDYLGIETTDAKELARLRRWFADGIYWCNTKLSNLDFLEADGFAGSIPPSQCVTATYEYVRAKRDYRDRGAVGQRRNKTGGREDEYSSETGKTAASAAQGAAWAELEASVEHALGYSTGGM